MGGTPGLDPAGTGPLQTTQDQLFAGTEATVVSHAVVTDLHADELRAGETQQALNRIISMVAGDKMILAADRLTASRNEDEARSDSADLAAAAQNLAAAQDRLASVLAEQHQAVVAVTGALPFPAAGLSVLGPAALSPAELAAWFSQSGFSDLTAASIDQLTGWYAAQGGAEGIRDDVAFAQAVLETGGFSSPDALTLNNYAGIGHCDTCAAGWAFPSPRAGVLGQLQLLRIFADAGAEPNSPAPAVAALTTSQQPRHGCCSTWESLTGVWATDPTYGAQILAIYQQMLAFTVSNLSSTSTG
jgi:flagellum-specific peptidoglycan hydrolase FlgJ